MEKEQEPQVEVKQEYSFVQERVAEKKKGRRLKKRLNQLFFTLCMAVVFGLSARYIFIVSDGWFEDFLGIRGRENVSLEKNETPIPTKTLILSKTPTPTKAKPTPTKELALTNLPVQELTKTPEPVITPEPTPMPTPTPIVTTITIEKEVTFDDWMKVVEEVQNRAALIHKSLVKVVAIESGVDWFQAVYEKRTQMTGLVVGKNGVELLILVDLSKLAGANAIEVTFGSGKKTSGSLYAYDNDLHMAIVAVRLADIGIEDLGNTEVAVIGTEETIRVGIPVMALGSPNGYEGSLEIGIISSVGASVGITDGGIGYFTTNIAEVMTGEGFVADFNGNILGMMTHVLKNDREDGVFTAVDLNILRTTLQKLLNRNKTVYFGIRGETASAEIMKLTGYDYGVYVTAVENGSPALNTGIKSGDVIYALDGVPVEDIFHFAELLSGYTVKDTITVSLFRDVQGQMKTMEIQVTPTEAD